MHAGIFRTTGLTLLLAAASANLQGATGRTAGTFDVTADGAATYSIPIWMPPAPQSFQPSLALVYNSLGRNGVVGVGWSIGGCHQSNAAVARWLRTVC
jgi:hypothetical protein